MRKAAIWMALLFCFGGFATVTAQEAAPITYGETVSGEVTGDEPIFQYTFDGVEGDTIYAFMYTPNDDLTPTIRLTALGGVVVSEASDNSPLGAFLGPLTLQGDATYTLVATHADWDAESTGEFELTLDRFAPTSLEPGVAVSGNLPRAGAIAFYTFSGRANDIVRFNVTGSNLGIAVTAPSGEVFVSNGIYDNPSTLFNILPETGDYNIYIQTANPGGDFALSVEPVEVQTLTEGLSVTGTSSETEPVIFSFHGDQGKLMAINASVPDADSRSMAIFPASDPCCDIVRDYGSGPNGSARIDPFIVPATDTYYVVLWYDLYSEDNAVLDYLVLLTPSTLISLAPGVEVNDAITPDTGIKTYTYTATAGEQVSITLAQTGGDGGVSLHVTSPDGSDVLGFEDASARSYEKGSVRSLTFELIFPVDGLYRFEIGNTDYDPTTVEYSLRVE